MVQTREERSEYNKQYYQNNKQKLIEKANKYYAENIENIKEYYAENKGKITLQRKEYYAENKDKIKKYNQTETRKKTKRITNWKRSGVLCDNFDELYNKYMNTNECDVCKHDFSKYKKSLDHCHKTGLFRQILCHRCNVMDNWKRFI